MRITLLSSLLLAGLVTLTSGVSLADDTTAPAASALPPGINPTSPAGGNGGDADGLQKKSVNPAPPGTEKKAPAVKTGKKSSTAESKKDVHKSR